MKRKFSKILGVGLTLALLTSLLLTATPVSALTQPSVTVADSTISAITSYSIMFTLGADVDTGDEIIIEFDEGIDISGITNGLNIEHATAVEGAIVDTHAAGDTEITVDGLTSTGDIEIGTIVTIAGVDGTYVLTEAITLGGTADLLKISPGLASDLAGAEDVTISGDVTIAATSGIGSDFVDIIETTSTVDGQVLTIDLPSGTTIIGAGAIVQVVVGGVVNPDDTGSYTLDVSTTNEDAKTSTPFEIGVPTIDVLPGIVQQFNAVDILMDQRTGNQAIIDMVASAGDNYTIVVGPGKYDSGTGTINITQEGLTLKSSAGAENTVIVATGLEEKAAVIEITGDEVTVDGFTIQDTADGDTAIRVTGDDATVINNIMTDTEELGYPEGISIEGAAGATVSGNELDLYHTMMVVDATSDCTLSDNIFGAGINLQNSTGIDIIDNDIIGSEGTGIVFESHGPLADILIEGNTISETTLWDKPWSAAIGFNFDIPITITDLLILNNDITDNEGVGIAIPDGVTLTDSAIRCNTITGNDADGDGYGISSAAAAAVDATFNWWGTAVADDVAAMVSGDDITYEPFLADTAEAVFSATDVAVGVNSLNAKDTVGVAVSLPTTTTTDVDIIAVAEYIANPEEAISGYIAFFDVYVAIETLDEDDEATIKFYAGDAQTDVYIWSADALTWGDPLDATFSTYGGYVWVKVDPANLAGTPFALVGGAAAELDPPLILAPDVGDDEVSLTPIFAWGPVTDAKGYCFELADNVNFVSPMVKLDGELGRLFVTAYAYVGELPYSTAYYWRVKAVSGAFNPWIQWVQDAHFDMESAWSTGVFITMDEPEEDLPPVVIEETEPPVIVIEPIVEVVTPAATEITPGWIYVIIAVGGVLVIALLVLIVRTRRVA